MDNSTDLYLYDYQIDQSSNNIILFGLDENRQKYGIILDGYKLSFYIDYDIKVYDNIEQLIQLIKSIPVNIIQKQRKQADQEIPKNQLISELISQIEFSEYRNFKGYSDKTSDKKLLKFVFNTMSNYQQCKKSISQINEFILDNYGIIQSQEEKDASKSCYVNNCEQAEKLRQQIRQLYLMKNTEFQRFPFRLQDDDNIGDYIYKLQRENDIQLCSWNQVKLTDIVYPNNIKNMGKQIYDTMMNKQQITQQQVNNKRIWGRVNISEITVIPDKIRSDMLLSIMTYDLEVYMKDGKFDQNGTNKENKIICIAGSYGQLHKQSELNYYCITSSNNAPIPQKDHNYEYIIGQDENNMLVLFFELIQRVDPEFISGFNDSCFDLPYIKDKITIFDNLQFCMGQLMNSFIYPDKLYDKYTEQYKRIWRCINSEAYQEEGTKWTRMKEITYKMQQQVFKQSFVKISASDSKSGLSFCIPGIIGVDTRTLLMKTQKIEKNSLNEYLKANNLDLKLEVSFKDMNTAYDNFIANKAEQWDIDIMLHVFEYCMYDSEACRLLWIKRNIIIQFIEVAKLSFTPLRCAFLKADGVKVRNMVAYNAFKRQFVTPMSSFSQDMRISDINTLKIYEKYPGAYVPEPKKGISISPVAALDFASLYPSIIMAHNLSPEMIISEQCHINHFQHTKIEIPFVKQDIPSQTTIGYVIDRNNEIGIYPSILKYLFDLRKSVKNEMEHLEHQLKQYQQNNTIIDISYVQQQEFQISLLNAKQSAIKVFMNTFYGETGNQKSPLFDLIIAGGTTTLGQKYIKQVHSYIEDNNCEVVYGDTDSIYFRPRFVHYGNQEEKEITSEIILKKTFKIADQFKQKINEFIGIQTYGFLKMEFEELLCPSMFTGKKKYCGVIYKPNQDGSFDGIKRTLNNKDILLKGIDFIKSQYPQLIKNIGNQTILDIMQYFNNLLLNDISYNEYQLLFEDNHRIILNKNLINIVLNNMTILQQQLIDIRPENYDLLASKKKIRNTSSGDMKLFKDRLELGIKLNKLAEKSIQLQDINNIDSIDIQLAINTNELQSLNIPIPQQGELIDIIYVQKEFKTTKTSQKMHLLKYAQNKRLSIDQQEYLNMYKTTGQRIIVCCCYEQENSKEEDSKEQDSKAMKIAKQYFDSDKATLLPFDQLFIPLNEIQRFNTINTIIHNQFDLMKLSVKTRKIDNNNNNKNTYQLENYIHYLNKNTKYASLILSFSIDLKTQQLLKFMNENQIKSIIQTIDIIPISVLIELMQLCVILMKMKNPGKIMKIEHVLQTLQSVISIQTEQ